MLKFGILVLIAVFVMDKANESFHWFDHSKVVKTSVMYHFITDEVLVRLK